MIGADIEVIASIHPHRRSNEVLTRGRSIWKRIESRNGKRGGAHAVARDDEIRKRLLGENIDGDEPAAAL